ncbi:MAG: rhamnan synthesis F family protein, partial [Arenimonas sp.]
ATIAQRDEEMEILRQAHLATIAQRDEGMENLRQAHGATIAQRDEQLEKLLHAHRALVARFEKVEADLASSTSDAADKARMLAFAETEIRARVFHAIEMRRNLKKTMGAEQALRVEVAQHLARMAELTQHLAHTEHVLAQSEQQVTAHESHIAALEATVSDAGRHIDQLRDILTERETRLADLHHTLEETRRAAADAEGTVRLMTNSRSWKLTAPLRGVNAMLHRGQPGKAAAVPALAEPFDRDWYLKTYSDVARSGMDPYQHYLMSGKKEGRLAVPPPKRQVARLRQGKRDAAPAEPADGHAQSRHEGRALILTEDFDEAFYMRLYPDIAASGVDPHEHFRAHGKEEGRFGVLPPLDIQPGRIAFDPDRETVLVVSHEASRTGAPILSLNIGQGYARKYNVVSLLLGGGPMVEAFLQESTFVIGPIKLRDEVMKTTLLMEQLVATLPLKFAVINSIESRWALESLNRLGVPTVNLIHEFAAYTRPRNAFRDAIYWAGETVFSTPLTCENALAEFPELADKSFNIAAQGRCLLVAEELDEASIEREDERVRARLRPGGDRDDAIVVIGAGFVQQRKGVDLFIDIAAKVLGSPGGRRFRFVWVGKGFDPENDLGYSVYLADQLRRLGLEREVVFLDETSRIETVYAATDILLLSSRLDPLPNVAIDAMAHGLPVVCFENTTGIATELAAAGLAEHCVARYLDTGDAAAKLLAFADTPELRTQVGERSREVVAERFDMDRYLARLEEIAEAARSRIAAEFDGVKTIVEADVVRKDFFYLPTHLRMSVEDVVRFAYLRAWSTGIGRRKLFPGFHPGVYATLNPQLGRDDDALVDWLQKGRPEGQWLSPVIGSNDTTLPVPASMRVALHLHVYYADLLVEMLARLEGNTARPDLFISVPNQRVADEVAPQLATYAGRVVDVQVVPNRGRDIGPLLTAFGPALLAGYDVVGHLHTKKTADLKDESVGKNWYRFLLENLLGGTAPMADIVLGAMAADPDVGLVFPDDPNVVSWGSNRPYAQAVAGDLGVETLPDHFQFPVGTMFWARVEALRPLIEHGFDWSDYPAEPLPYDGSLLHALERLFPLVTEARGYRTAVTNVRGVTR